MSDQTTEASVVRDLTLASQKRTEIHELIDGSQLVVFPDGRHERVHRDEADQRDRHHVRGVTEHQEVASFVEYVNSYKSPATVLFTNLNELAISAVIDHHTPPAQPGDEPVAGHRHHLAAFRPVKTVEWAVLTGSLGHWLTRGQLSELLAELEEAIVVPDPSTMRSLAEHMNVSRNVDVQVGQRRKDGNRTLQMVEQTKASGGAQEEIPIPDHVLFSVRPHTKSPTYQVRCEFQYQLVTEDKESGRKDVQFRLTYVQMAALERSIWTDYKAEIDEGLGDVRSVIGRDR